MSRLIRILCGVLAIALAAPREEPAQDAAPERLLLGSGDQRYEWVRDWPAAPEHERLGSTHAGVVFDRAGNIYVGTNSPRGILVFDAAGALSRTFGAEYARGLHGLRMVEEAGVEQLLLTQLGKQRVVALTLEGELIWELGRPEADGLYEADQKYRPTSVAKAPDGRLFVADGYGQSWVHLYDAERHYLHSIGGLGMEPGQFTIPHGLMVDTRSEPATLLVADRGNHRVQRFTLEGELIGVLDVELRRPCSIASAEDLLVIADLDGRVTILDESDRLVVHLGDNPNPELRGQFKVERKNWKDGAFLSPHDAAWDTAGNLYVEDWNLYGRVTKLARVR